MKELLLDSKYPVCIVGVGARTPVGLTAPSAAAAVRAAIAAIGEHPDFVDKAGEPMIVAMDPLLSPDVSGVERFYALTRPALEEALAPLVHLGIIKAHVPVFLGLPQPRPGLPAELGRKLTHLLDQPYSSTGSIFRPITLPLGHSAGLIAMEEAWRQIQQGRIEFCLAGGVDSYMEPETLEWLDREGQLLSAENRSGFPPGEGASFCLLTTTTIARQWGLDVLAWVVALATAQEENCIKTETICIGKGLSDAIFQVTKVLSLPEEKISTMICDMNGERYRTEEFTFTALRTQAAFVSVNDFMTPADCWGDMGAASGPLFANLAVASGLRRYAKGPRILLWTSSEGGQRSAAILHVQNQSERVLP